MNNCDATGPSNCGVDDTIDWNCGIGDSSCDMLMTSGDDEICSGDMQEILNSIDFLDTFSPDFESRYDMISNANDETTRQDDSLISTNLYNGVDYSISVGQPTCEMRDKMNYEYLSSYVAPDTGNHLVEITDSFLFKKRNKSGKGPSHRTTKKKTKGLPKRPLSKYNLFFQSERLKILDEAIKNHTRISFENLAKIIGKRWHSLTEEESEKFRILSEKDIVRYREEMQLYRTVHQNTATSTGGEEDDDRTVSSKNKKAPTPRSPESPKRKRRYSEDSATTVNSENQTPTAKVKSPKCSKVSVTLNSLMNTTCRPQPNKDTTATGTDDCNTATIVLLSPQQNSLTSSLEDVGTKHSPIERITINHRKEDGEEDVSSHQAVRCGNEKGENIKSFPSDLNLPLLDVAVDVSVPSTPPQTQLRECESQDTTVERMNGTQQPDNSSQQKHASSHHRHHDDRNTLFTNIPPPPLLSQPHTNPSWYTMTAIVRSHSYPLAPPPHPHYYIHPPPPPLPHFVPHDHRPVEYHNRKSHHPQSIPLPMDHNKEVMIYDPQMKRERSYRIQYKCYSMKRSDAYDYMSQMSSTPSAVSSSRRNNNHHIIQGNVRNVSVHQLINSPLPVPSGGVEVDLSQHQQHVLIPPVRFPPPIQPLLLHPRHPPLSPYQRHPPNKYQRY